MVASWSAARRQFPEPRQILAGSTAIWDAIWATSNELLSASAEHTRRADDSAHRRSKTRSVRCACRKRINRALKADALIYSIGIGDRYEFGIDEAALKKTKRADRRTRFFPSNERDLTNAFAQIERDLERALFDCVLLQQTRCATGLTVRSTSKSSILPSAKRTSN